MTIFNPSHFLRHISMPLLRESMESHPLGARLSIDWACPEEALSGQIIEAVDTLDTSLQDCDLSKEYIAAVRHDVLVWHDDLRRVHLLANDLAVNAFQSACQADPQALDAIADRDNRERSLWIFSNRDQIFRDVELQLAFQAKANGKYWKKHRIQAGLDLTRDRDRLEAFGNEVAKLYKSAGGGKSTYIECSRPGSDGSIQLTLYVEGPITALTHFTDRKFNRVATRIALETALVYQPATGVIETVVLGGAKNHTAVLELFGKHVVDQEIELREIEKTRFRLNTLRNGLETFEDLSIHGVENVRLRRGQFKPVESTGISIRIEATADRDQDDAITLAHKTLTTQHAFETQYHLDGASFIVRLFPQAGKKPKQFSFDVSSTGSSTIKNLSQKNQSIANAVLQSLHVIEAEEPTF